MAGIVVFSPDAVNGRNMIRPNPRTNQPLKFRLLRIEYGPLPVRASATYVLKLALTQTGLAGGGRSEPSVPESVDRSNSSSILQQGRADDAQAIILRDGVVIHG